MKKITLLFVLLCFMLVGCEGDFTFDKATVVSKSATEYSCRYSPCYNYLVTVLYNGSNYNVTTDSDNYRLVTEGSVIRVRYDVIDKYAHLTPVMK